jgi:hypothetical protein
MRIKIEDLEFKFKFRDDEDFPATMTLFIGQFEVRGFTIRKTKFSDNSNNFALFPPANRSGHGKWVKIFFTEIKNDWKELEDRVLQQFNEEHTDYLIKNNNDEIDVNNISF